MQNNMNYAVDLCYLSTNTRINEKWNLKSDEFRAIVSAFPANSKYKNFFEPKVEDAISSDHALNKQAFLHVVTETVFNYPTPFFSEKTFKPISSKRPFVIVGAQGTLSVLRSVGFKTFSDYWDESYDETSDPEDRLAKVVDVIEDICDRSVDDLRKLCLSMEDVLNYNLNHYSHNLKISELEKFENACQENLNPRHV